MNSNETHRPGPEHIINRPRSNDPYTLHPQRDYLHDFHSIYVTFNLKTIEPPLLRFHHCNAKYPYNHYMVPGLLHIEKHYAQHHMSLFYYTYMSDTPDLSVAPNMWIYHDRQLTSHLRLFNWNPHNDSCNSHVRQDITNNTREWYHLMYKVGELAFAALTNIPDRSSPEYNTFVFNIYYEHDFKYNHGRDAGHYWSQQMTISDYVQKANAIGKCGDASNEILIDTLLCALVYDFMAFVAQTLGYDKVYGIRRVQLFRRMLYTQLNNHVCDKFFMDQSLNVIFAYTIENAIPVYDAQRVMLITQTMHNDLNSHYP